MAAAAATADGFFCAVMRHLARAWRRDRQRRWQGRAWCRDPDRCRPSPTPCRCRRRRGPGSDLPSPCQHARVGVGRKAGADRDIGRPDRHRVERRRRERADAGIRLAAASPLKRLRSVSPLPKSVSMPVSANPLCRATVARRPSASMPSLAASSSSVPALEQIAAALERREIAMARVDRAQPVFAHERRVADQIGRDRRHRSCGSRTWPSTKS